MRMLRITLPRAADSALVLLAAALTTACPGDDTSSDGGGSSTDTPATGSTTDEPDSGDGATTMVADETGTDDATTAEPGCEVTPGEWAAPDFETNAAEALALRAQLDALTGDATMRGAETGAVVVDELSDLTAVWAGEPSLAAVANPGFVPVVEACFDEFLAVIAAGDQELVTDGMWAPGPDGGIWGDSDRGINEGGLEVRQIVDKGSYSGGLMYAYAVGLTEGDIGPQTIDAIAAAWGNNADLDPMGELTDAASYSYQMGFHAGMAVTLTAAKAYAESDTCTASRDAALVSFFEQWELSMQARLIFYGHRAAGALLVATNGTELAVVLHDLTEGLGLAAGFIGLPDPASGPLAGRGRIIDDAQTQALMAAFGVDLDDLGASTTGTFLESLPAFEAAIEEAEGVVMDVYGVDSATVATWVMPTPG